MWYSMLKASGRAFSAGFGGSSRIGEYPWEPRGGGGGNQEVQVDILNFLTFFSSDKMAWPEKCPIRPLKNWMFWFWWDGILQKLVVLYGQWADVTDNVGGYGIQFPGYRSAKMGRIIHNMGTIGHGGAQSTQNCTKSIVRGSELTRFGIDPRVTNYGNCLTIRVPNYI